MVEPIGQATREEILGKMPPKMRERVHKIFIHEEKSLAVISMSEAYSAHDSESKINITFGNKVATVSPAYLVIELPSDHEDISASRFTDNEELRYSLRSLEKHAPWVQHVYIITNGQIPYWLNLDNPTVTVVTHQELFPNASHLPTFSSPAIECHLHRIPGLSRKFIYLNDDVLFGKPVWPEDFYTHTKGQKVYLSWPVPNCAEGCPSSWIRDGYCDKPCNNSQCQWDGGDCTPDNPLHPHQGQLPLPEATSYFHQRLNRNYCNNECADTWLADRYCDKACNVHECGYDAGDCGVENFDKISQLLLTEEESQYYLPEGERVGFFNLSLFLSTNRSLSEGLYEESPAVRTIAISLKYAVIGIVLHPNHNATRIPITLKGELHKQPYEKKIYLHVLTIPLTAPNVEKKVNETLSQTEENFTFEEFQEKIRFPKLSSAARNETDVFEFRNVNVSASSLPESLAKEIRDLEALKDAGFMTVEGFLKRKSKLIAVYIQSLNSTFLPVLVTESSKITAKGSQVTTLSHQYINENADLKEKVSLVNRTQVKIEPPDKPHIIAGPKNSNPVALHFSDSRLFPKGPGLKPNASLKNYFMQLTNMKKSVNSTKLPVQRSLSSPTQRHLLDTFGDSLRHVNKLYNEAFGYESRKVPSHIAHFVDREVMTRLTQRFDSAFEVTSSHRFRSSDDMQFAFSYYYYMMSEMDAVELNEIFDTFDVDKSGAWGDREIRTILARLYDLPLSFSSVSGFEQLLINCSLLRAAPEPTPHTEHYYDPNMPLVSRSLVLGCPGVAELLLQHFGNRKKNSFEVVGEEEVAFKMIHNNLTQVLTQIDDLRKTPRKFVCLNDNMNHGTQEAEVIRAVIQDFYESLFPVRSQFELSPDYRNRFLRVEELREWRRTRDIIRAITYFSLALLILFSVYSFWKSEMRSSDRYPRLRNIRNRNRNSQNV